MMRKIAAISLLLVGWYRAEFRDPANPWKDPVLVATTTALPALTANSVAQTLTVNATGACPTIDGITVARLDRVLVKDSSAGGSASYNGIYFVSHAGGVSSNCTLTRDIDANMSRKMPSNTSVRVERGTVNGGHQFYLSTVNPIVLWTTSLTWTDLETSVLDGIDIIAGDGLTGGGPITGDVTIDVDFGSSAGTVCEGNDSRLSDSRAPTGAAGGDLGGTYPNPTVSQARGLRETAGPTTLAIGAVADGECLARSGSTIDGVECGGGGEVTFDAVQTALAAATGAVAFNGQNITSVGTVDGRDVSVDGTKIDGIEALADVTDFANVSAALAAASGGVSFNNQSLSSINACTVTGVATFNGNVNLGNASADIIDIVGHPRLGGSNGSFGQMMTSNGSSGQAFWADPGSHVSLQEAWETLSSNSNPEITIVSNGNGNTLILETSGNVSTPVLAIDTLASPDFGIGLEINNGFTTGLDCQSPALFSAASTFDGDAEFNGALNVDGPADFDASVQFDQTTTFNAAATFNSTFVVEETGESALLTLGAVADGQVFARSGLSIVGVDLQFTARNSWRLLEDFDAVDTSRNKFSSLGAGTGSTSLTGAPSANHPTIIRVVSGSTTNAWRSLALNPGADILTINHPSRLEFLVKASAQPDATNNYTWWVGFMNLADVAGGPTEFLGARVTHGVNSALWQMVGIKVGGGTTASNCSAAPTTGSTWQRLVIETNSAGNSATLTIDGVACSGGAVTTNITGGAMTIGYKMSNSGGSSTRYFETDYFDGYMDLTR